MVAAIQLLCFDLGGVVVRIHRSWGAAARAAGLTVRDGFDAGAPETSDLVRRYQAGVIDTPAFVQALSTLSRGLYTPQEIARAHDAWLIEEYEEMAPLLSDLRRSGLQLAVLSNTNDAHWPRMLSWPALAPFHHRLPSHLIGAVKPDPAAYRAVERASGVSGSAVLFFDDTQENIDAARAVGWRAELIDPTGSPAQQVRRVLDRTNASA